jgi:hypothetical protein
MKVMWTQFKFLYVCVGSWQGINSYPSSLELTTKIYGRYPITMWTHFKISNVKKKNLFISARILCRLIFTCLMFCNSIVITVKIVNRCIKQTHYSVNLFSLLTLPLPQSVPFITFLPQYVICCSIHTVCCKHVLIRCSSRASDGLIGHNSVSVLHKVYMCSEVRIFTFYVQWPI